MMWAVFLLTRITGICADEGNFCMGDSTQITRKVKTPKVFAVAHSYIWGFLGLLLFRFFLVIFAFFWFFLLRV